MCPTRSFNRFLSLFVYKKLDSITIYTNFVPLLLMEVTYVKYEWSVPGIMKRFPFHLGA